MDGVTGSIGSIFDYSADSVVAVVCKNICLLKLSIY